jgi:mono/diheme cytochrome c family protein
VTKRAPSAIPVLLTICLPTLAQGQDAADQSAQAGRALAIKICSACHIVSADQPFRPILRRPGPEFQATEQVVSYILSLRKGP